MTHHIQHYLNSEKIAIIAMLMVATLAIATIAVSYEYAFAKPTRAHTPAACTHVPAPENNRHCITAGR